MKCWRCDLAAASPGSMYCPGCELEVIEKVAQMGRPLAQETQAEVTEKHEDDAKRYMARPLHGSLTDEQRALNLVRSRLEELLEVVRRLT